MIKLIPFALLRLAVLTGTASAQQQRTLCDPAGKVIAAATDCRGTVTTKR